MSKRQTWIMVSVAFWVGVVTIFLAIPDGAVSQAIYRRCSTAATAVFSIGIMVAAVISGAVEGWRERRRRP